MLQQTLSRSEKVEPSTRLPRGGPMDIDRKVAEVMIAHLEVLCLPIGTMREKDAERRRDALLRSMSDHDRQQLRVVANGIARLAG